MANELPFIDFDFHGNSPCFRHVFSSHLAPFDYYEIKDSSEGSLVTI